MSPAVLARADRLLHVATLRTDARDENRHVVDDFANFAKLLGIGRADDEGAVVVFVPFPCYATRHPVEEFFAVGVDIEVLKFVFGAKKYLNEMTGRVFGVGQEVQKEILLY